MERVIPPEMVNIRADSDNDNLCLWYSVLHCFENEKERIIFCSSESEEIMSHCPPEIAKRKTFIESPDRDPRYFLAWYCYEAKKNTKHRVIAPGNPRFALVIDDIKEYLQHKQQCKSILSYKVQNKKDLCYSTLMKKPIINSKYLVFGYDLFGTQLKDLKAIVNSFEKSSPSFNELGDKSTVVKRIEWNKPKHQPSVRHGVCVRTHQSGISYILDSAKKTAWELDAHSIISSCAYPYVFFRFEVKFPK